MGEGDDRQRAATSGADVSGGSSTGPIDLTKIVPPVSSSVPVEQAVGSPEDVGPAEPAVDKTRRWIAYFLLALLAAVIVFQAIFGAIYSFGCWYSGQPDRCDLASKSLAVMTSSLGPVFTAMVGLVGSVVGFYFGSKSEPG